MAKILQRNNDIKMRSGLKQIPRSCLLTSYKSSHKHQSIIVMLGINHSVLGEPYFTPSATEFYHRMLIENYPALYSPATDEREMLPSSLPNSEAPINQSTHLSQTDKRCPLPAYLLTESPPTSSLTCQTDKRCPFPAYLLTESPPTSSLT